MATYWMRPHVLDLRSLALFRIFFGLLQLYSVYSRTRNGKYDLAWYTSYPPEKSYVPPGTQYYDNILVDSFPLVGRGTVAQEICFFIVYAVLAFHIMVGLHCRYFFVVPFMWFMSRSLLQKSSCPSDGSDQLICQLLIWMSFLPISEVWSIDALLHSRCKRETVNAPNFQVSGLACLGLTLQVVMVYTACVMVRTFDNYTLSELKGTDWFGPDYSLVFYAANGNGTRKTWVADLIRNSPRICQIMTASSFWVEALAPLLCLLFNQRYSHWFGMALASLHFGIGLILNIPQWMMLGMLVQVIWIPTHVWDWLLPRKHASGKQGSVQNSSVVVHWWNPFPWFYFYLLISTWCNVRGWSVEWLQDSSESLAQYVGFDNNWAMWGSAPRYVPFTKIHGHRRSNDEKGEGLQSFEIFHFIRTGKEVEAQGFSDDFLDYSTYEYPSPWWEKGIGDEWETYLEHWKWSLANSLGYALCNMVNEDLANLGSPKIDAVEIILNLQGVSPPYSEMRFTNEVYEWNKVIECATRECPTAVLSQP